MTLLPDEAAAAVTSPQVSDPVRNLFELVLSGGPLMAPIGLCSIVALGYAAERWLRLRPSNLGGRKFGRSVVAELQERGISDALELCAQKKHALSRIVAAGLRRAREPFLDREKVVEDQAAAEVRRLSRNLRPLFLVWLVAPLLGLLGTVWGMIEAFGSIAHSGGIGNPELLAGGITKALTTTAAGLAVSIPAIVLYWWLQGRIENFARD
ncbi:MAG: MotA/TolQ/ExbB proton channel family protein, partial [Planctomycetota bacterium]